LGGASKSLGVRKGIEPVCIGGDKHKWKHDPGAKLVDSPGVGQVFRRTPFCRGKMRTCRGTTGLGLQNTKGASAEKKKPLTPAELRKKRTDGGKTPRAPGRSANTMKKKYGQQRGGEKPKNPHDCAYGRGKMLHPCSKREKGAGRIEGTQNNDSTFGLSGKKTIGLKVTRPKKMLNLPSLKKKRERRKTLDKR